MKRTLNLLPAAEARPLATRKLIISAAIAVALYALALVGVWSVNYYEARKLDATIAELNAKKLKMQQYLSASAPSGASQGVDPAIVERMKNTPPWDAVLSELSLITPNNVWLEVIESSDARHLRLKGYSGTQSAVAKLIEQLESSRYFGNVEIVFAQKGEKATTFEIVAEMTWT